MPCCSTTSIVNTLKSTQIGVSVKNEKHHLKRVQHVLEVAKC